MKRKHKREKEVKNYKVALNMLDPQDVQATRRNTLFVQLLLSLTILFANIYSSNFNGIYKIYMYDMLLILLIFGFQINFINYLILIKREHDIHQKVIIEAIEELNKYIFRLMITQIISVVILTVLLVLI